MSVIVVGAGIRDSVRKARVGLPRIFYSGMLGSDLFEVPKSGEGKMLSGRIVSPPAPSLADDGSVDPPGALEPDGSERDGEDGAVKDLPIRAVDLSCKEKDGMGLIDQTDLSPKISEIASRERVIPPAEAIYAEYGEGSPLVLIIHTHGTECYSPDGADSYPSDRDFRSLDPADGVCAVGDAIEKALKARGIGSIHVTDMFDAEDFSAAYTKSAEKVRRVMRENPSVKYVIDVHRDALITEEGVNLRPVTEFGGKPAAQLMTVVGTDEAGSGHDGWRDNLALAMYLQKRVGSVSPGLMRAVNLRSESFNQQYSPGYLLLEAGAAANSLIEAERGAVIFADALADYILG